MKLVTRLGKFPGGCAEKEDPRSFGHRNNTNFENQEDPRLSASFSPTER
jgi:hypothetical protein